MKARDIKNAIANAMGAGDGPSEAETRLDCLGHAVETRSGMETPASIIERAKEFEIYVRTGDSRKGE